MANRKTNRWLFALQLGFYAGIVWGGLKALLYLCRFTEIVPGFMIEGLFKHSFLGGQYGIWLGWGSFILFSLFASLLYACVLWRTKGPWPGMFFGLIWFALLYPVGGYMLGMIPRKEITSDSLWVDGSLFVMWGLFIGYTFALEFTDERRREPHGNPNGKSQDQHRVESKEGSTGLAEQAMQQK